MVWLYVVFSTITSCNWLLALSLSAIGILFSALAIGSNNCDVSAVYMCTNIPGRFTCTCMHVWLLWGWINLCWCDFMVFTCNSNYIISDNDEHCAIAIWQCQLWCQCLICKHALMGASFTCVCISGYSAWWWIIDCTGIRFNLDYMAMLTGKHFTDHPHLHGQN